MGKLEQECNAPSDIGFVNQTKNCCVHDKIYVRFFLDTQGMMPDFRAFMYRILCVNVQNFLRSYPDLCAFNVRILRVFRCLHTVQFLTHDAPLYVHLGSQRT